jgi:hypothetical protein
MGLRSFVRTTMIARPPWGTHFYNVHAQADLEFQVRFIFICQG